MSFEINNNIEQREKFEPTFEIGSFEDIKSTIAFYAISKKINNEWGNEQNEEVADNIKKEIGNVDEDSLNTYEKVRELSRNNDETLRWLAFAVDKGPDIKKAIIEQLIKHKGFSQDDADMLLIEFFKFYNKIEKLIKVEETRDFIDKDIFLGKERLVYLRAKVIEAIDFFRPDKSEIKRVVYLPTNPLEKKQSGNGISTGETFYINAERGNEINEIHEFLHSIINPITEKINLSEDEEKVILNLCPAKLREYKYPKSILTEEIIRTYRTGFKEENKSSFENFKNIILGVDRDNIKRLLDKEAMEGIQMAKSVDELLENDEMIKRYYERYSQDVLAERTWNFFEDYRDSGENFERYLIENKGNIFK